MNTNDSPPVAPDRRPLDRRKQSRVPRLARALDAKGFSPNGTSGLGIVAALVGVSVAYVRAYPASGGLGQDFRGPGGEA